MPLVDLIDETFIVADPRVVAAAVHDPDAWRRWWPGLELVVFMDRGIEGIRWTCTGELVGSTELWLEAWGDGVIVHYYLRADPTRPGSRTEPMTIPPVRRGRVAVRESGRRALEVKRALNGLKDSLEAGRRPGTVRPTAE